MTALLDATGVSRSFQGLKALDCVNIRIGPGERVGLIGPNGSGKTTLINCLSGRLLPDAGRIAFGGTDVTRLPAHARARLGLARGFQIPQPFAGLTLRDNLLVPLEFGRAALSGGERIATADALLDRFGLLSRRGETPAALSQVDLRRLELARAMAGRPRLLIADEVMAGLSDSEADTILDILLALSAEGIAVLMVEHVMRAVRVFSQKVVCLVAGQKVADGDPDAVLRDPLVEKAYLGE